MKGWDTVASAKVVHMSELGGWGQALVAEEGV